MHAELLDARRNGRRFRRKKELNVKDCNAQGGICLRDCYCRSMERRLKPTLHRHGGRFIPADDFGVHRRLLNKVKTDSGSIITKIPPNFFVCFAYIQEAIRMVSINTTKESEMKIKTTLKLRPFGFLFFAVVLFSGIAAGNDKPAASL